MSRRGRLGLLFVLMITMFGGCEGCFSDEEPPPDPPSRDEMTPAQFFNATQEGTSVPHERIKAGSARDAGNGRIRYDTVDGQTFEVTAIPNGQGGYHYTDPVDVTEAEQGGGNGGLKKKDGTK